MLLNTANTIWNSVITVLSRCMFLISNFCLPSKQKVVKSKPHHSLENIQSSVSTYLKIVDSFSQGYSIYVPPWKFNNRVEFLHKNRKLLQFLTVSNISENNTDQSVINQALNDLTSSIDSIKQSSDCLAFAATVLDFENAGHIKLP